MLMLATAAHAQTGNTLPLSLQQAKDLALKNRYDVQANLYDVRVAGNNRQKIDNEWLPDLNATGNARYNPQLQATLIPGGFFGADQPQLLAFGAKNTTIFGLELNQTIYKPTLMADTRIAQNNEAMQKEKNRAYEINIRTQVTEAYLDVQLKALQLKIITDNENRYKDYYIVADATYKAGSLLESDLLKAKLDFESAKAEKEQLAQRYALAIDYMKYQLNVPANTQLVLTDSLATTGEATLTATGSDRTELKQLQLQHENIVLQERKIRQGDIPSLSFFANYSQQYLSENLDYGKSNMWSPFSYLGLKLNVPISGLYKSRTSIQEYKLKGAQTDLLLQQKTADINYEIQNATTSLRNAGQNMSTAKHNYQLSQNIYGIQQQQYKSGALLYRNLLDTERSLSTAEQNYIKAVYDYLLAKMKYQQALGRM